VVDVSQRSPTRLNPRLDFLAESAAKDNSSRSRQELSKFGLDGLFKNSHASNNDQDVPTSSGKGNYRSATLDQGSSSSQQSTFKILFGSFSDPFIVDSSIPPVFSMVGDNFARKLCMHLPNAILEHMEDL
jgi:hypothetical protein